MGQSKRKTHAVDNRLFIQGISFPRCHADENPLDMDKVHWKLTLIPEQVTCAYCLKKLVAA